MCFNFCNQPGFDAVVEDAVFGVVALAGVQNITIFETINGKEILNKPGVSLIAPQDLILTPDLLLKK